MRMIVACAAVAAVILASVEAQDAEPAKPQITDEIIINTCGGRLAKMFAQFGPPNDIKAKRGNTPAEDDVFCDYGPYGFKVRGKLVRACFFFDEWKEPIRGIKIGDSREDVAKVLGKAPSTVKNKEGAITAYGYELKDLDANFFANFDEDGKVWRVEISLK